MPKFLVAGLVLIVVMVVVNRILAQKAASSSSTTPQLSVIDGGRSMPLGNRSSGNQGIG